MFVSGGVLDQSVSRYRVHSFTHFLLCFVCEKRRLCCGLQSHSPAVKPA